MIRWMAWHLHWRGLLAFTIGGFLISVAYGGAYAAAAGTTTASRAAFGQAISAVAGQFAFLIPVPVHPETLGGYEQYKWISGAIILMMIWAAVAGIAVGRGEEERGLTDEWLATGVSRARLLLSRSAAFGLVLTVACFASTLGISAIAPLVQSDPYVAGELGKALSMTFGLFCCYTIALLVSQLPAERQTATAFSVGALVVLLLINGIADTVPSASWIGVISPFHWMEKTTSAAPGGTFDVGATIGLALAAAVMLGLSVGIFQRRDVGSGLISFGRRAHAAVRVASRNVMLRLPFTEGLWEQRVGLAVWAVSTFLLGAIMVSVVKSVADALNADPNLAALFSKAMGGNIYEGLMGIVWFGFALLILAAYAVVQVSRWAAQDSEGRVEMLLSTPVSRTRVVIDRAFEFAVASLLIVIAGSLGVAAKAPSSGLNIGAGHLFTSSLLMWPFALAFGGLGVAVVSRWPRIAVPFLAAFAAIEYFLGDLAPVFKFPGWVANLSVFHLFGNPLAASSISWTPPLTMILVFAVGFAAALLLMRQRDVSGA
jgi:ABC-2 type transport system permease protein